MHVHLPNSVKTNFTHLNWFIPNSETYLYDKFIKILVVRRGAYAKFDMIS